MTVFHAIVLGAVQGLTEFLPVSSKTHLVVVPALLGWREPPLAFLVWLHLGTLFALLVYFLRTLVQMLRGLFLPRSPQRRTFGLLVLASLPAAVVGLAFESVFEKLLSRPRPAAAALLATSVILVAGEWFAGRFGRHKSKNLRDELSIRDAAAMGVAQAFALLPGVSRSGSTMSAGLISGAARPVAAEFSFLMALVAVAGAGVLEISKVFDGGLGAAEIAGFAASLVTGYAAVAWLLRYLRTHSFLPFAAYCAVFATGSFLWLSR